MLVLNLKKIAQLRGIQNTYTYFMSLGYSSSTASLMNQGKITGCTTAKIEKYCLQFNCTPNDLFDYYPNPQKPLPQDHPLLELQRQDNIEEIKNLLQNLPIDKIRALTKLIREEQ
jgi:DNA-binding Xre family transcriptional regulator